MSIPFTYGTSAEAHKAGWFSRRHQDNAAHRATQQKWLAEKAASLQRAADQLQAGVERQKKAKANAPAE